MPGYLSRCAALGLLGGGLMGRVVFTRDMERAHRRLDGQSTVISSPFGEIEYAEGGKGSHHVLVSHGSGGGWDQGLLIGESLLDDRFHWIAPSRLGYLRSSLPADATFDHQAHAYCALLDHLGIQKVAVIALSHGGPAALLFAVLHPERVASLTLISAGVAASSMPRQQGANRRGDTLVTVFDHDWLYWLLTKLFRKWLLSLMGAPSSIAAQLSPAQQELASRFITEMNPVSLRSTGALFDNHAALPGDRIAAITAPTLIVHAADDTLQRFHNAEFAATAIPGAQLLRFERGGHLVVVAEQSTIRTAVMSHILENDLSGR